MAKEDDINALPNVDLGPVIDDLKKTADKEPQQTQTQTQDLDLGQFKNPKDLLKSYKEIQSWATKISQEKKDLERQLAEEREQRELAQYQPPVQQVPQNTIFNNQIQPDQPQYMTREEFATSRIAEVLEEEAHKDGKPDPDFRERYAFAQMMASEYPNLARTPVGVRKLFELGDKRRMESLRKNANKALESIFGGPLNDEETQRLVKLVKGDKATQQQTSNLNAYMPDTSTSTMSGQNQNQLPNADLKIKESVKKGDVDGVIRGLLEKADILTAE